MTFFIKISDFSASPIDFFSCNAKQEINLTVPNRPFPNIFPPLRNYIENEAFLVSETSRLSDRIIR